jgi:hypothetical protein
MRHGGTIMNGKSRRNVEVVMAYFKTISTYNPTIWMERQSETLARLHQGLKLRTSQMLVGHVGIVL